MIKYLLLIVFLPFSQSGLEGVYTRHQQMCSFAYTVTKVWTLTLRKDSIFIYSINEDATITRKQSAVEKKGRWSVNQDTLRLLSVTAADTLLFVIDGIRLEPVNKNEASISGFKLDFLRKNSRQ